MRTLRLSAVLLLAVALTTSCSLFGGGKSDGDDLASALNSAVGKADGVTDSKLTVEKGSSGNEFIKGNITLEGPASDASTQLEAAFRAMAPVLKDKKAEYTSYYATSGTADGAVVTPEDVGLKTNPNGYDIVEAFGS